MLSSLFPLAIVEVLILQRFPYGKDSTFFYLAQKELLRIQEGDVVEVPWRNQFSQGVVVKIKKFMGETTLLQEAATFDFQQLKIAENYFLASLPDKPIKIKKINRIISKQYFKSFTLETLKKLAEEHFVSWNHFVLSAYLTESKMRYQRKSYLSIMGKWVNALRNKIDSANIPGYKGKMVQPEIGDKMIFLAQDQTSFLRNVLQKTIQQKKQILVLTGEKSQTLPLAIKYFLLSESFLLSTPLILSKILPSALFKKTWQETKKSSPTIFIGNRSAIFAPFANLGLIILENGHDANFKQWDGIPKYDTRKIINDLFPTVAKIYLSSTPRLEDFWQSPFFVEEKSGQNIITKANINNFLQFKKQTVAEDLLEKGEVYSSKYNFLYQGEEKKIKIINLKIERQLASNSLALGQKTVKKIVETLQQKKWAVVIAGHRGWANLFICSDCGFIPECPECGQKMIISARKTLDCSNCGFSSPLFSRCPKCQGSNFRYDNFGFEQIQQELQTLVEANKVELLVFPETNSSFSRFLIFWDKLISSLEKPIVILGYAGSLPTLNLLKSYIGFGTLIPFDNLLFYPDFRSEERTASRFFGLLSIASNVAIQTYFPRHPFLLQLTQNQYAGFFPEWLKERREFNYPPFVHLWELEIVGYSVAEIREKANRFKIDLEKMPEVSEVFLSWRKIIFRGKQGKLSLFVKTSSDFKPSQLKKSLPAETRIDPYPENLT